MVSSVLRRVTVRCFVRYCRMKLPADGTDENVKVYRMYVRNVFPKLITIRTMFERDFADLAHP